MKLCMNEQFKSLEENGTQNGGTLILHLWSKFGIDTSKNNPDFFRAKWSDEIAFEDFAANDIMNTLQQNETLT